MRTFVGALLFGVCVIAGPAQAQQHPWLSSGATEPTGSLPDGTPAEMQHPWVPSGYRGGAVPNDDGAWASSGRGRSVDSTQRRPAASRRDTSDTK
jgi:hypothetical protein